MQNPNRRVLSDNADHKPTPPSPTPLPTDTTAVPASVQLGSSSMAMAILFFISAIIFVVFFSLYTHRLFSDGTDPDGQTAGALQLRRFFSGSAAARGLDPEVVRALPLLRYAGSGGGGKEGARQLMCVVCLGEFEAEEVVKAIPACGHVFHPRCIDAWLLAHGSCPLCRCSEVAASRKGGEEVRLEVVVVEGGVRQEDDGGSGGGDGGGGEEEEEEDKRARLRRSRSWSWRVGGGEGTVFLRRSRSF